MCKGSSTHRFRFIGVSSHLTLDPLILRGSCLFLLFLCTFWCFSSRCEASMIQVGKISFSPRLICRKSIITSIKRTNLSDRDMSRRIEDISLMVLQFIPCGFGFMFSFQCIFCFSPNVIKILYFYKLFEVMNSL